MERKNEEFRKYLKNKFGKVADYLLEKDSLTLKEGSEEKLYHQEGDHKSGNREKVEEILKTPNSTNRIKLGNGPFPGWAFDFPGWIGSLDLKEDQPAKKIMVIGMEPHIQCSFYQVAYAIRKPFPDFFDNYQQLSDNYYLHNNLSGLFAEDTLSAEQFYHQFYITDMCHFAPKGNASLIKLIPNWDQMRAMVAHEYLEKEIEFIAPKIIISSGLAVADFVDNKVLKKIAHPNKWIPPQEFWNQTGSNRNLPFISLYDRTDPKDGTLKPRFVHIGVPHLASGLTQHFWTDDNRKELRDRLSKFMEAHGITL